MKLITEFINNCEVCTLAKFDRHPVKIPFKLTETASNFNDIVHIDIWFPYRNIMYLTTIDKFSKYATIHKLNDRTWISILKALKERIQFLGKMNKLIYDNERCILHNAVTLFLKENSIESHITTANNKTGNSDVERLHGTLNEHLRILEAENSKDELDDKLFKIVNAYNNTIHSTTKLRPIDFIKNNLTFDDIEALSLKFQNNKITKLNELNKKRDSNYELLEDVVRNRNIAKNKPKYNTKN